MKRSTLISALTASRLNKAATDSNMLKKDTAVITPHKSYFKMKLATDFRAACNDKSLGFNNFDRKGDV